MINRRVAITVDVETDWGGRVPVEETNCYGIEKGLDIILQTLANLEKKATFFISGELAEKRKELVRRIDKESHEIAGHGYSHRLNYRRLDYEDTLNEVKRSKQALEDIINKEVVGFRSPEFKSNSFLFKALNGAGFIYDSSLVRSFLPAKYNNLNIPEYPYRIDQITEIPISSLPFIRIPYGLLWINLIGLKNFYRLYNRLEKKGLLVFYVHPFDLLREKPKQDFGPIVKLYYSIKSALAEETFSQLMDSWNNKGNRFVVLSKVLRQENK